MHRVSFDFSCLKLIADVVFGLEHVSEFFASLDHGVLDQSLLVVQSTVVLVGLLNFLAFMLVQSPQVLDLGLKIAAKALHRLHLLPVLFLLVD